MFTHDHYPRICNLALVQLTMFDSQYSVPTSSLRLLFVVMTTIHFPVISNIIETNTTFNYLSIIQPIKSIYYDLSNHQQLQITMNDSRRLLPNQKYQFSSSGISCDCHHSICECCTGMKLGLLDLNRICAEIAVKPEEFSIQFLLLVNDKVLIEHTLTGKNPPPICPPVPLFPPLIKLCIRFYNIHLIKNTLIVCVNFETIIGQWSVFILHFNCMVMSISNGANIMWVDHPNNIQSTESTGFIDNVTLSQQYISTTESEVYDGITFEPVDSEGAVDKSVTIVATEEEIV